HREFRTLHRAKGASEPALVERALYFLGEPAARVAGERVVPRRIDDAEAIHRRVHQVHGVAIDAAPVLERLVHRLVFHVSGACPLDGDAASTDRAVHQVTSARKVSQYVLRRALSGAAASVRIKYRSSSPSRVYEICGSQWWSR